MMLLFFGFVAGALFCYAVMVAVQIAADYAWANQAMTDMMNMVPKENRYGYTEDFPADQKWHL